jgi:hypothetical protein
MTQKDKLEISVKQKKQIEHTLQGSINPKPNHKIWEVNEETGEILEAQYEQTPIVYKGSKTIIHNKKLIMNSGCVYIPSLNKENAKKHYLKNNNQSHYFVNKNTISLI